MSKSAAVLVDFEDRDPKNLSNHLQVIWTDVVGEPERLRSPECVWRLSQQCFKHSLNYCYITLTVLLAPFTALCLGCSFACLAFEHIWCILPCLRIWKIICSVLKSFVSNCLHATVVPCMESLSYLLSNIKIKTQTNVASPIKTEAISYSTHVI